MLFKTAINLLYFKLKSFLVIEFRSKGPKTLKQCNSVLFYGTIWHNASKMFLNPSLSDILYLVCPDLNLEQSIWKFRYFNIKIQFLAYKSIEPGQWETTAKR
jgi:hypothetical protein